MILAVPALEPRNPLSFTGLAALRTARDLLELLAGLAGWGALETLRGVPAGLLAALVFGGRDRRRDGVLRVGLPAAVLALAGVALAVGLGALLAAPPPLAPLRLLLGSVGALLGVGAGLAWRRGRRACIVYALQLLAAGAALLVATGVMGALAIEREPRTGAPTAISSEDKRRLFDLLRGKNPRNIPEGETRTVRLTAFDLDRLSAWATAAVRRGHGVVRVEGPGMLTTEASIQLPWPRGYWLNVAARSQVAIQDGKLDLDVHALRVGRIPIPRGVLAPASPLLVAGVTSVPRVAAALRAVRLLRIEADGATATWGRLDAPEGTISWLMWGGDVADVRAHVGAYVARLLEALPGAPAGDRRFAAALETALAEARERSRAGSAVEENRAALIALGIVLGHEKISKIVGDPMDAPRIARVRALRESATVRGRNDWVRHFTVSGAFVALSWVAPSDAAGLFKEERDASGGSGFSFGDLLADRAGTTFGASATRDEAAAAAMQERLAHGVRIDDLFPPAADLPEDIQDAELQRRYGGVGGPLFRRYAEEIERRVSSCAAYRR